jgi:hypothetical protein
VVALLIGLIALPAAASLQGTADAADGTVVHQLGVLTVGTRQEAGAQPEHTYRWDQAGIVRPSSAPPPDERSSPGQTILRIGQAALIIGVTGLGLGITFTSLLSDMKRRRRVVYRPRGP